MNRIAINRFVDQIAALAVTGLVTLGFVHAFAPTLGLA